MIETIRLRNFRRYVDATFELKPGVNFIEGPNNAGKTTVLYAIEYALFGRVGRLNPSALMHPKTRSVGVELVFRGNDGKRYRLQRVHLRPPKSRTKVDGHFTLKARADDEETEHYVLSSDFQDHETALARVLTEAIGVGRRGFDVAMHLRQGEIASVLAGAPELDLVLGVTAAVAAAEEMRALALEREKEAAALPVLDESRARLEEQVAERRARADTVNAEGEAASSRVRDLGAALAQARGVAAALEPQQRACAALEDALAHLATANEDADRAAAARDALPPRTDLAAASTAATDHEASLVARRDALRAQLDALRDARSTADAARGDLSGRLDRRRHLPVGDDAVCEACGQAIDHELLNREIPELEAAFATADAELASLVDRIAATQADLDGIDLAAAAVAVRDAVEAVAGWDAAAAAATAADDRVQSEAAAVRAAADAIEVGADPADLATRTRAGLQAELDAARDARIRAEADVEHAEATVARLEAESADLNRQIADDDRELARVRVQIEGLNAGAARAAELRTLAVGFKQLQEKLRAQATDELARTTLDLHGALSVGDNVFRALAIDPKKYAVDVTPGDVGESVPAWLYQGGGHRLLLGLAFKLAVARLVGPLPFILLDEPTYGLDVANRTALLERIQRLQVAPQMIVITHHDVGAVAGHRIRVVPGGRISTPEAA